VQHAVFKMLHSLDIAAARSRAVNHGAQSFNFGESVDGLWLSFVKQASAVDLIL